MCHFCSQGRVMLFETAMQISLFHLFHCKGSQWWPKHIKIKCNASILPFLPKAYKYFYIYEFKLFTFKIQCKLNRNRVRKLCFLPSYHIHSIMPLLWSILHRSLALTLRQKYAVKLSFKDDLFGFVEIHPEQSSSSKDTLIIYSTKSLKKKNASGRWRILKSFCSCLWKWVERDASC